MRIAVIGWGALIWDTSRLSPGVTWSRGGPGLPLAFSNGLRPHLTIDVEQGRESPTHYLPSHRISLKRAVEDFRVRDDEQGVSVGRVVVKRGRGEAQAQERDPAVVEVIRDWCAQMGFDAAIWRWSNEPAVTFH